jgi:hypothetical protein
VNFSRLKIHLAPVKTLDLPQPASPQERDRKVWQDIAVRKIEVATPLSHWRCRCRSSFIPGHRPALIGARSQA